METIDLDSEAIKKDMEESFRNSIAPLWYLHGTRFIDLELNTHCREILQDKDLLKRKGLKWLPH